MINLLEETQTLQTYYKSPKVFIVVGAGGTGGYLIPNLARQISIQNNTRKIEGLKPHQLVIIDEDEVSLSNLNRQNFIESDLNKNKAEVMANRYGGAFGLDIEFLAQYVTTPDILVNIAMDKCKSDIISKPIPVFIDCVDNNKTRVLIHEAVLAIEKDLNVYYLSSGNENYNGQVVCGYRKGPSYRQAEEKTEVKTSIFETPMVTEMFPEVLKGEDKLPTELSCDEMAVSHPQNIMTNITAANLLFNFANIILTANGTENNPGLRHFAQTFDTQTGKINTFMNKKSVLENYIVEKETEKINVEFSDKNSDEVLHTDNLSDYFVSSREEEIETQVLPF